MYESGACNDCTAEETIEHLLCYCPSYANEMVHLRTALHHLDENAFTVDKTLGRWDCASQFRKATKALL